MAVILIYVAIVLVGDAGAVLVAEAVEHFSESDSLMVFFALFALTFWFGWLLSVYIVERIAKA
jgi:hypothetical protein